MKNFEEYGFSVFDRRTIQVDLDSEGGRFLKENCGFKVNKSSFVSNSGEENSSWRVIRKFPKVVHFEYQGDAPRKFFEDREAKEFIAELFLKDFQEYERQITGKNLVIVKVPEKERDSLRENWNREIKEKFPNGPGSDMIFYGNR